jgi:cation:H+ antiporter
VVIGLTVVAFGTSMPELVVSVISSVMDKSMIAVGNVIGSNICNIALVLGTAALFQPIKSHPTVVKRDFPIMLVISLILLAMSYNSTITRIEGAALFIGVLLYTYFNYKLVRMEEKEGVSEEEIMEEFGMEEVEEYVDSRKKQLILIIVGIAGVVGGAQLVVESAVVIMTYLGVSEKFIGLTIVAFGTSLPELATSVVAAMRKELDISIGNLVGSNVFNIMSVIGVAALVRPIPIPGGFFQSGLYIDYMVMFGVSALPMLMMWRDNTVSRIQGGLLLACYLGYLTYLITKTMFV